MAYIILNPKEKAEELIKFFRPLMYCFVGSEMLSNTYNEQMAVSNAKKCCYKLIDEIVKNLNPATDMEVYYSWVKVRNEVTIYTIKIMENNGSN